MITCLIYAKLCMQIFLLSKVPYFLSSIPECVSLFLTVTSSLSLSLCVRVCVCTVKTILSHIDSMCQKRVGLVMFIFYFLYICISVCIIFTCHAKGHIRWMEREKECWLLALRPNKMLVYLRDRPAQTILRAATLRQKLQAKLSISPSHSILTPGQPVPALTL